uniref:Uncharacterized protein n=1 Tax=Tanacetum cinerariifolium TaxID=118510 RepID=A0A699GRM3_TANCI|nr:hypothetical protein [Tanacetum cinerariifolium]
MTSKAQQSAIDNALVAHENQRVIRKCNIRMNPGMKPKESTYQVVLDALVLTTCYSAFFITAKVLVIYMHQFWAIGQEFKEPPTEEEALSFICKLGHSGEIKYITNVIVDHLHQPWRSFASIINKCICEKVSGLDMRTWLTRFDNEDTKKLEHMFYPRFTKIIIHHFLRKDKSISMRDRTFMHTAQDDSLLGSIRFVSRDEDAQIYVAILPKAMTNQAILDSIAYKTYYAIAFGAKTPKSKKPKMKSDSTISSKGTPSKKKPTKAKKRWVPEEQQRKTSSADERTGTKPGVLDANDVKSDANDNNEASDSEKTDSDEDDNLNLNLNDEEEEEDARTPDNFEFRDDDEKYDELYKDVIVRLKVTEHEEVWKGDAKMTNTTHESASQEKSYEQVIEDAHVTLTSSQKTKVFMMNVKTPHDELSNQASPNLLVPMTGIPETSSSYVMAVTLTIQPFSSIPQMTIPTHVPTTEPTTSSIPALPYFVSLFRFDERVSALEQDLSQVKQYYTTEFEKKVQAEKEKYNDIIKKLVKEIIKDEVKSQLPHIIPREISDFATPVIHSTINESLENIVLAKSSSQPQSTYEAATSLTEFQLKKILLKKLKKSKLYQAVEQHKDLYGALRGCEDKDKDEDPLARSDQGLKKKKTNKDVKPSRGSKSKESKSSSSNGSKPQSKSSGKSAQAEELMFDTANTEMPQD